MADDEKAVTFDEVSRHPNNAVRRAVSARGGSAPHVSVQNNAKELNANAA